MLPSSRQNRVGARCSAARWIGHMKLLRARETAAALRARILDHLAREDVPELADIRIVRGEGDLDPAMRPFVISYLRHIWSRGP